MLPVRSGMNWPIQNFKHSPLNKVKESPVENHNERPAQKSKRCHYVHASVMHELSFGSVQNWILQYERTQAALHSSEGRDQTLWDLHYSTIPEKNENYWPFEETLVSDLSTSGAFSDCFEPSTFEMVESNIPPEETLVSQDISTSQLEKFSHSADLLAAMRRMTLCSGGEVTCSEPVENDLFYRQQILICFHCQTSPFVYPLISKSKLICKKHGGCGSCPITSYTEKCQEANPAQLLQTKYQYFNYNCFMCDCTSCDLRSFNCDLKCGLCLRNVKLCRRCLLYFPRGFQRILKIVKL